MICHFFILYHSLATSLQLPQSGPTTLILNNNTRAEEELHPVGLGRFLVLLFRLQKSANQTNWPSSIVTDTAGANPIVPMKLYLSVLTLANLSTYYIG